MSTKEQNIRRAKQIFGSAYHEMKILSEDEARLANQERDKILKLLSRAVNWGFKRSKIYLGELSPGCLMCGRGKWSCMHINVLCTSKCFFCIQNRKIKKEGSPKANEIVFDDPEDYVDYLEKFNFKGVGFSGGESMLVFEKMLFYNKKIRQKL